MSFLAPLFLLGAMAVALPVLFHLIRRTTRERLPFSSLMFLQATPPRVTRRSRLENILLLVLRCLVLVLLTLGFARPFLQKPVQAGLGSRAPGRIVVLVDASASMRRERLWPDAQAKLEEVLRKTAPADQVAVLTFDRQVHTLVNFEQWSSASPGDRAALLLKRVAEMSPGWGDTHLGNALIAAAELFEEAGKQDQPGGIRRIVVISDLQEGSRLDGLQGYEWPRGIELVVEPLKARRPTNAGLQLVTEREDSDRGATEIPRVRVSNSADAKREQFQVSWLSAGENRVAGTALEVYVPPSQSRVALAPKPAGAEGERLSLSGDDEDFDNTVYLVPPKAEQVNILFLGADAEQDSTQLLYYLRRGFQQTRGQVAQVLARTPAAVLLPADTADSQLMVVSDPLPEDRLKTAQQFLKEGKTVLLVMKTVAGAALLGQLAVTNPPAAEEAPVDRYAILNHVDFQHPLFAPFADARFSDFTKIHFWKHRRLMVDAWPGAKVPARFDNNDPALIQLTVGKGTLLVLTSGWQPSDSQLALSSKFVPLLYSLLELSGGLKARLSQYAVGDPVPLPREVMAGGQKIIVRKPDSKMVELPAGEAIFVQTDQPGIYTVVSAPSQFRFAVNLAAEESKTAPLALEELQRLGIPLHAPSVLSVAQAERKRLHLQATELENRQKLWRWLIVIALAVLLLETWLGGRLARRVPAPA